MILKFANQTLVFYTTVPFDMNTLKQKAKYSLYNVITVNTCNATSQSQLEAKLCDGCQMREKHATCVTAGKHAMSACQMRETRVIISPQSGFGLLLISKRS